MENKTNGTTLRKICAEIRSNVVDMREAPSFQDEDDVQDFRTCKRNVELAARELFESPEALRALIDVTFYEEDVKRYLESGEGDDCGVISWELFEVVLGDESDSDSDDGLEAFRWAYYGEEDSVFDCFRSILAEREQADLESVMAPASAPSQVASL